MRRVRRIPRHRDDNYESAVALLAFSDALRHHDPKLRRLVWRLVGDADLTDDLLQESYLRAFQARATFSGTADGFGAWLYRITYNLCLDHLRATRRRPSMTSLDNAPHAAERVSVGEQVTTRGAIRSAVSSLSPEQAAAVVLIDLEELDYAQAAEILDVSVGTLSSRVNRGRAALRSALGVEQVERRGAS